MTKPRVAILISGRGSNMRALLAAMAEPDFPAAPALVISNDGDAPGLADAFQAGVATGVVDHTAYPDRERFEIEIHARLLNHRVDFVCLAGFMRVLSPFLVSRWEGRMLNIHPALLPAFPGLHTHRRALEAGVTVHGATVHFVTADLDAGPAIGQAVIPVARDENEDSLAARVLIQEHKLFPACLALMASGRTRLQDGRVLGPRLSWWADGGEDTPAAFHWSQFLSAETPHPQTASA